MFRSWVLLLLVFAHVACDAGSNRTPTSPSSHIGTATPTPTPVPTPTPASTGQLTGTFGVQPTPVAGIVSLEKGSTLRVNGGRFTNTDPAAALRLVVSWGDGERGEIGCGPCRLEHVYPQVGSFSVRVTVVSGQAAGLTEASEEFTVVVSPATAPRVTRFTATPAIVQLGSSSTLTWETENAISVAISPGSGGLEPRGSTTVTPTQASTTYTLTAVDVDGQEATASVTVAVLAPAIGSFTATPPAINLGASSTLAWSGITGATTCSINQGIGAVSCAGGSTSVSPTSATTYELTATGPGGNATATASVTINSASIGSFTATPSAINLGASSTLAWSGITGATTCSINQGIGAVSCAGGSTSVSPTSATTYELTATGPGGNATATASVTMAAPTAGTLSATPTTIDGGSSSTLAWTASTNATSCSIDQGIGTVSCAGGATSVSPTATTTYTLTATGPGGSNTSTATVTVQYCHSIVSADGACPTGATRYCQATPIVATSSSHAQSALLACFGADASTTANSCSAVPRGRTDISSRTTYYYDTCSSLGAVAGDIWRPSTGTFIGRWAN